MSTVRRLVWCSVAVVALALLPALNVAATDYSKGDIWNYQVTDTYQRTSMSGTMSTSYVGTTRISVNGTEYATYVLASDTSLALSGEAQNGTLSGSITLSETTCYDVDNLDTVRYEYNQSVHAVVTSVNWTKASDSWEHNITTFSPPRGFGKLPTSLAAGDRWTISYPSRSEVTRYVNGTITYASYTRNNTVTYRYEGVFQLKVPAGDYQCQVLEAIFAGGTATYWYSDAVGNDVQMSQQTTAGEQTTWTLTSFTYSKGVSKNPGVFYAAGVAIVVVSVALVLLIIALQRRKRKPPAATSLQQDPLSAQYMQPNPDPRSHGQ